MPQLEILLNAIYNIIGTCSGGIGVENYDNMNKQEFIEWFKENIKHNNKETQELGNSLINILQ